VGATGVAVNVAPTATFSRAMDATTITSSSFTLTGPSGAVAATVGYAGTTATLTPNAALANNTTYTASLSTTVKAADDVALASARPIAVGATGVAVNVAPTATFSRAMDATTITSSSFTLTGPSGAVAATVGYSGTTATLTPNAALANNTSYTASLSTTVKASD